MFRFVQALQRKAKYRFYAISLLVLVVPTLVLPAAPMERVTAVSTVPQIDWLEPRGLSIASLVGLVPEDHLLDAILAYRPGYGLVQYASGQRSGTTVTISTRMTPRYWLNGSDVLTRVGCLGQMAVYDEWPGAVLPAQMRVFADGADITSQAVYVDFNYAGQIAPEGDASDYFRYPYFRGSPTFAADGSLSVPENTGCNYFFSGRHNNLTAQFTFIDVPRIQVTTLGSESFTFHSYIGVGSAGQMVSLNNQMQDRFGNRHDKFTLTPPEGAEYFLAKFPPTPVEPYPDIMEDTNVALPASGSYRIGRADNTLSVDHSASMAMPLHGQWQDADQSGGDYLSFFADGTRLAAPEYFVPAGVAYNPCMRVGGCSADLLNQIYNAEMTITIYYYRIDRIADGLTRIPLKQVGPDWKSNAVQRADMPTIDGNARRSLQESQIYMPFIANAPEPTPTPQLPPDDANGCPCGWFDGYGRMMDYIPPQ